MEKFLLKDLTDLLLFGVVLSFYLLLTSCENAMFWSSKKHLFKTVFYYIETVVFLILFIYNSARLVAYMYSEYLWRF